MFKTQVVLMQSFEHFDVISMIDKSRDHGILSSIFVFYGNIDSFWRPFLLKFLGRWCWAREKEENKSRRHQVISIVCTVIDHSFDQAALEKSIFVLTVYRPDAFGTWKLRHDNTETSFDYLYVLFLT